MTLTHPQVRTALATAFDAGRQTIDGEALGQFLALPADERRALWNEEVLQFRARRKARKQRVDARRTAKTNAAVVAATRSAACPICFATHAGEC